MRITFHWCGGGHDPVPLKYTKQIPEVSGTMGTLSYKAAGVLWGEPKVKDLVDSVHAAGPECEVIEPVNVHEDIKLESLTRDRYIDTYNRIPGNLAKYGVKVVVYSFMPVLDWLRTDPAYETEDDSNCLCYDHKRIEGMSPRSIVELTTREFGGLTLSGWEPERLAGLDRIVGLYQGVDHGAIHANYRYFLEGIIPTVKKAGIKMACHPDDPAWDLFGLPHVYHDRDDMDKTTGLYDSDNHGSCICVGSLGSSVDNDIPAIIHESGEHGRLHAAHVCNVKHIEPRFFHESPHPLSCGDLDMYTIMEAICETSPNTYIRPNHGRMIWGEAGCPGYPLYDRASGAVYLTGLHETIKKIRKGE